MKDHATLKVQLHTRNRHRERYDFKLLVEYYPELAPFVLLNAYNNESIDFSDARAVKALNTALLRCYYDVIYWDIPDGYLCPPIPGRADYIHYVADLLAGSNNGIIPTGSTVRCFDVGVGANCVYPIIGIKEYGWSFIGSDVDEVSIVSANKIIIGNTCLKGSVECRLQTNNRYFFRGIVQHDDYFDISICNPPYNASLAEAQAGTIRKLSNLQKKKITKPVLNFGGKQSELCCDGGEERFIMEMIRESRDFSTSCLWFSTLVSKKETLDAVYYALEKAQAVDVKTIQMGQGNKITRIVAWTFLSKEKHQEWARKRFNS